MESFFDDIKYPTIREKFTDFSFDLNFVENFDFVSNFTYLSKLNEYLNISEDFFKEKKIKEKKIKLFPLSSLIKNITGLIKDIDEHNDCIDRVNISNDLVHLMINYINRKLNKNIERIINNGKKYYLDLDEKFLVKKKEEKHPLNVFVNSEKIIVYVKITFKLDVCTNLFSSYNKLKQILDIFRLKSILQIEYFEKIFNTEVIDDICNIIGNIRTNKTTITMRLYNELIHTFFKYCTNRSSISIDDKLKMFEVLLNYIKHLTMNTSIGTFDLSKEILSIDLNNNFLNKEYKVLFNLYKKNEK